MGLLDQLQEMKDLPDEITIGDDAPEVKPEVAKEPEPAQVEEPEAEEPEAEEKPEVSGYQKRKIKDAEAEAQRERARADELQDALIKMTAAQAMPRDDKPKVVSIEPDKDADPDGWIEHQLTQGNEGNRKIQEELQQIKNQMVLNGAKQELSIIENNFVKDKPDYHDAVKFGFDREVARQMVLNPKANEAAIRATLENEKVQLAAMFQARGENPVAKLYEYMVQVYGYQPKGEAKTETKSDAANFDAVKRNKGRSVSPLSAGGQGAQNAFGPQSAKGMSVAQFSKLSAEEKRQIYGD